MLLRRTLIYPVRRTISCLQMPCPTKSAISRQCTDYIHLADTPLPWEYKFMFCHDDVIKWKHFPRYWPFVRGIHRSPVNSPHKGQWRGALMFSLICAWINGWVNNREAGDLRRHRSHYEVTIMWSINVEEFSEMEIWLLVRSNQFST